jgi:anaerobic magnesium-protoporphyrin IX monomethyl ester cyclase
MNKNKILLMTPPYHCGVLESAGIWPPIGLTSIAGDLKQKGLKVFIYDAMSLNDDYSKISRKIKEISPDFLGIGAYTSSLNAALKTLQLTKKINPEIITFLGGIHPTFMYYEILKENNFVDFIIRGEGEITTLELIQAIKDKKDINNIKGISYKMDGKIINTPKREFIENLDEIKPAFELLNWKIYKYFVLKNSRLAVVNSSRGCNQECTFCSQQKFWEKTWRGRTPKNFLKEIELLYKKYKVNVFLICDEFPTKDRERWEEILNRIIHKKFKDTYFLMETRVEDIVRDKDIIKKYRKAGIVHIYIGVEATNQETLNYFKKDLKIEMSKEAIEIINKAGIISETSFILGTPDETKESIKRTLKLAKFYNPDFAHFLTLTPWPYADIYKELKNFIEDKNYSKYNLIEPVIKPKKMTLEKIKKELVNCYRKYYLWKLKEYAKEKDSFKKNYFFVSMKEMMKSSFLKTYIPDLGKIPKEVEKYLKILKKYGN